jgi:hypothetical protein
VTGAGSAPRVVFLDFEASSLGKRGFPVEVAWVFETGEAESHLIRPAPDWTEWSAEAEAVHGIARARLQAEGRPAAEVARRALEVLSGHRLFASAPSWDGQWLSRLLRGGGLPRHALRLRDTEEARAEAAAAALAAAALPAEERARTLAAILEEVARRAAAATPEHRALGDARRELALWREARRMAAEAAAGGRQGGGG